MRSWVSTVWMGLPIVHGLKCLVIGACTARRAVRLGEVMDAPSDQSAPTGAAPARLTPRKAVRSRRRRPTGAPPPLPHNVRTSGVGWLVAAVVLVGLALAVFAHGLRGPAVTVTVADDAVVRWLGELQ